MRIPVVRAVWLAMVAAALGACASAPPWGDMPESEIAAWLAGGFEPDAAQTWKADGFSVGEAKAWRDAGFEPNEAMNWKRRSFSSAEATAWKQAGFDLDKATEDRARGLQPIR